MRLEIDNALEGLSHSAEVLLDLTAVSECNIDACRALALMQRRIGSQGVRTAYLASRARIRGAAWWIVHASGDPHAMPVTDMGIAEQWFASDAKRVDEMDNHSSLALERALEQHRGEIDR